MSGMVTGAERPPARRRVPVLSGIGERLLVGVRIVVMGFLGFFGGCAAAALVVPGLPVVMFLALNGFGSESPHFPVFAVFTVVLLVAAAPLTLFGPRLTAWLTRMLAARWCGVTIPSPYRTYEEHRAGRHIVGLRRRIGWVLCDPATWRDLLWNALVALVVFAVGTVPGGLVRAGVDQLFSREARATAKLPAQIDFWMDSRFQLGCLTFAVMGLALGLALGPRLLTAYGAFARVLLGPTKQAELARRVRHLAETRSATLDTGAAAMRRIERDLHDGAQARLVATGMTLGAAEALIDDNPAAARALLMEAKESSAKALAELRDLVRGIHPPVLADRGLVEALRALALDLPLKASVAGDLPGRPPAPVESAAYFAVSELLANVVKHARAGEAWVDVRHTDGALRIGVTDDGRGGADPTGGSGLRGIEQRLAAFDGVLAVSSPLGGPTVVNLEIQCVLSSPKTSTS